MNHGLLNRSRLLFNRITLTPHRLYNNNCNWPSIKFSKFPVAASHGYSPLTSFFSTQTSNNNEGNDNKKNINNDTINTLSGMDGLKDNEYVSRDTQMDRRDKLFGLVQDGMESKYQEALQSSYTKTLADHEKEINQKIQNKLTETYLNDDFEFNSLEIDEAFKNKIDTDPDYWYAALSERLALAQIKNRDRGAIGINLDEPPPRMVKVDKFGISRAIGRRKKAIATCEMRKGTGNIVVNGISYVEYFNHWSWCWDLTRPFQVSNTFGEYDVQLRVRGGGKTGQVGACRLAIARALQNQDPNLRTEMKADGLMTRDSRRVERKHYGHKKARKSFTFVKR